MRCVIRSLHKIGNVSEYRDDTVEADTITIGRSLDQDIVLPGSDLGLRHARLSLRNGKVELSSVANNEIFVNEQSIVQKRLELGDIVKIGQHAFTVISPPSGFDVAIELRSAQVLNEQPDYEASYQTSLSQTRLNKRRLSWLLGLIFLLTGLVIPFLVGQFIDEKSVIGKWLVSDAFWISGPLVKAHQSVLDHKCTTCHETPFRMVRNTACDDCHKTVTRHTRLEHPFAKDLDQRRCATCHKEHNEPGTIIDNDQSDCAACHATLDQKLTGRKTLMDVHDFDESHPDFTLTLLVENQQRSADTDSAWIMQREVVSDKTKLIEKSNLKFNHKLHMDSKGVETPSGDRRRMVCKDCHQLDAAGMHNKPINMKDHCEECHKLSFDPRAGDFMLPHGSVRQVVYVMQGFYQDNQMMKSGSTAALASQQGRVVRRPGQRLNMLKEITSNDPRQRMENALAEIFERTTCVICHAVSKDAAANPPWIIKPVKLNNDWMPKATFNHQSHAFKKCDTCHASEASERSEDILMPAIKICRDCHTDRGGDGKLASPCIECHRYHVPGNLGLYASNDKIQANIDKALR